MELLSHRGFWKTADQKNTKEANELSFKNGWGIETDIRDYNEELVISHDIATNNSYTTEFLFDQYRNAGIKSTLALNIKADGLSKLLLLLLEKYNISNYFVFDMSVPETLRYLDAEMNVFIRCSEFEKPDETLYDRSNGIWLDIFKSVWYDRDFVNLHITNQKKIAFVSPELHGRDEPKLWEMIKENNWHSSRDIMLCTDLPDAAIQYFKNGYE
jgi:hypothetical protein